MKKKVVRTYKFRLYPSKVIAKEMGKTLDACRFLYNAELEYENQLYFSCRRYADRTMLNYLIRDWGIINPNLKLVHSQVLQNVSDRLCNAFNNFFARIKRNQKAGFPRFKSKERYDSFTYPQSGFKLKCSRLRLSKIGIIDARLHRKIKGKIKTLTIKKSCTNKWFVCFSVVEEKEIKRKSGKAIGIDVGLENFYADSEGNKIPNPRWLRKSEERLAFLQRKYSKKKKKSENRKRSRLKVAKLHEKIVNQRNDFLRK